MKCVFPSNVRIIGTTCTYCNNNIYDMTVGGFSRLQYYILRGQNVRVNNAHVVR